MTAPIEAAPQAKLDAARAKVAKLTAHLDGAYAALAEVQAEFDAAVAAGPSEEIEHSGEVTRAQAGHAHGTGSAHSG